MRAARQVQWRPFELDGQPNVDQLDLLVQNDPILFELPNEEESYLAAVSLAQILSIPKARLHLERHRFRLPLSVAHACSHWHIYKNVSFVSGIVTNQADADEQIKQLSMVETARRELLVRPTHGFISSLFRRTMLRDVRPIDGVIVRGGMGREAMPMTVPFVRDILEQCKARKTSVSFSLSWGTWIPASQTTEKMPSRPITKVQRGDHYIMRPDPFVPGQVDEGVLDGVDYSRDWW